MANDNACARDLKRSYLSGGVYGLVASVAVVTLGAYFVVLATGRPRTVQFQEATFDFGRVSTDVELLHHFRFTNLTGRSVSIAKVVTSCGCIASSWQDRSILPGESGTVSLTLSTRDRSVASTLGGKGRVFFEPDDGEVHELEVRAEVAPDLSWRLARLVVGAEPARKFELRVDRGVLPPAQFRELTLRSPRGLKCELALKDSESAVYLVQCTDNVIRLPYDPITITYPFGASLRTQQIPVVTSMSDDSVSVTPGSVVFFPAPSTGPGDRDRTRITKRVALNSVGDQVRIVGLSFADQQDLGDVNDILDVEIGSDNSFFVSLNARPDQCVVRTEIDVAFWKGGIAFSRRVPVFVLGSELRK